MRVHARISFLALLVGAIVVCSVPAAAQAFGVEKFFAGNCIKNEKCGQGAEAPKPSEEETNGYRLPGGDVPFGATAFRLKTVVPTEKNALGQKVPEGSVKELRVDVAPGFVTNPQAAPMCSVAAFTSVELPGTGYFFEPECSANTIIGKQEVETAIIIPPGEPFEGNYLDVKLPGLVYNLEQPTGWGSYYGVALATGKEYEGKELYAHSFIEGNVEWASDYHDYFVTKGIAPGLIESRLTFEGTKANTFGMLRNTTACFTPGRETTTYINMNSYEGASSSAHYENKVGALPGSCTLGFAPTVALTPEATTVDQPDGVATSVKSPHPANPEERDTAALNSATITLPEGLTMNPSAAAGLEGCTRAQFGIESPNPVTCPSGSRVGAFELEVPTLPAHSLKGGIYLGKPEGKPIEGPPYTIYLDAESARYGVKVRVEGQVHPNLATGRLETTFANTSQTPNNLPAAPFTEAVLKFNGGTFAPLANPLTCTSETRFSLYPYSGSTLSSLGGSPFGLTGCSATPPAFAPTQTGTVSPAKAAATSNFTFTLTRPEGQQYVSQIRTVLPEGLAGKIPTVTQCAEAQAGSGTCPEASEIGNVRVLAGSGEPYPFTGKVYLTGPYAGAPFGLVFEIPVVAGPFSLGTEVVRAKITVEPYSSRVVVTSPLPTIRDGIPARVRSVTVEINRPNFMVNPTSCASTLATESSVLSTLGATALISGPFHEEGCSSLEFKPSFTAKTSGKTSKANGASIETTINQPSSQANIKSVLVQLPKQLPSRLTTLNKACLQAVFEANPFSCPSGSFVGGARANTPLLPGKLQGPAIFVSHGGEAFPDLDLVMEANGVRVILIGKTKITKGITTTNFATTPDTPVSSVTVNLPTGPHSALAANGNLCTAQLVMPTTITGQNGKTVKQNTIIKPVGCPVQVIGQKVIGNTAYLTVKTFAAGRISGSGSGLATVYRHLKGASNAAKLDVPLSSAGRSRERPFRVQVRVGFVPKTGHATSVAYQTVTFN